MEKHVFPIILVTFATFVILLPMNTQPSFGSLNHNQLQATVVSSQKQNTLLANNSSNVLGAVRQVHQSLDKLTKITLPLSIHLKASPPLSNATLSVESSRAPLSPGKYVLQVQMSYNSYPSGNYSVYVDLPRTKSLTEKINDIKNYYVGAANFFDPHSSDGKTITFTFDITDELNAQWSELGQSTPKDLDVLFVSDSGSTEANIAVESITLYKF